MLKLFYGDWLICRDYSFLRNWLLGRNPFNGPNFLFWSLKSIISIEQNKLKPTLDNHLVGNKVSIFRAHKGYASALRAELNFILLSLLTRLTHGLTGGKHKINVEHPITQATPKRVCVFRLMGWGRINLKMFLLKKARNLPWNINT